MLTVRGLEKLASMKYAGLELPLGYDDEVRALLASLEIQKRQGKRVTGYWHAKKLARILGVEL